MGGKKRRRPSSGDKAGAGEHSSAPAPVSQTAKKKRTSKKKATSKKKGKPAVKALPPSPPGKEEKMPSGEASPSEAKGKRKSSPSKKKRGKKTRTIEAPALPLPPPTRPLGFDLASAAAAALSSPAARDGDTDNGGGDGSQVSDDQDTSGTEDVHSSDGSTGAHGNSNSTCGDSSTSKESSPSPTKAAPTTSEAVPAAASSKAKANVSSSSASSSSGDALLGRRVIVKGVPGDLMAGEEAGSRGAEPAEDDIWVPGRVTRYTASTNKHYVEYNAPRSDEWLVLSSVPHAVGDELVWAKVKGWAAHPGLVLRHNDLCPDERAREAKGGRKVLFFADWRYSWLNKKKLSRLDPEKPPSASTRKNKAVMRALEVAREDLAEGAKLVRRAREKEIQRGSSALESRMVCSDWVGAVVRLFRPEINYPSGAWVTAEVG